MVAALGNSGQGEWWWLIMLINACHAKYAVCFVFGRGGNVVLGEGVVALMVCCGFVPPPPRERKRERASEYENPTKTC